MPRGSRIGAALLATLVVAVVAGQGPMARAAEDTTPPASVTFALQPTEWSDVATLPLFDPAMGELREVHLTIDADMEGTIALENLAAVEDDVQARAEAAVTVHRPAPGLPIATSSPGVTRVRHLNAYDGTTDHAGPSGSVQAVNTDLTTVTTLTDPADLLLFTGIGTIVLPTTGTDESVAPADPPIDSDIDTSVGATVSVSYTYVSDTRPPDPPTILTSPPAFTANPDPVITFTHEAGATAECQLTTPLATDPWAACASPWEGHLDATGDGAYVFAVRATDADGNVGEPATRGFTLDRVAPAQPSLTFTLLGPLPLLGTWSFSIEPGATARCSLDGAAPAPCTSPVAIDLGTLLDGDHTFTVFAVDAAGNAGPPASSTHGLDRVAPVPPTITSHPSTPGNDPTPTWAFDLAPDATTATCAIDGATPVACTSPFTANLASASDGTHTLDVRNADASGNVSGPASSTYALDRGLPGAPTLTGPPSPSNDTTPEWDIDAEPGASIECRLDSGTWEPCAGTYAVTFAPGSDGVHVVTARATDAAGNVGPEATSTFSLDTTPPPAPGFVTVPPSPTNDPLLTWTFDVEPGATASCSLDGAAWEPCTSPHTADVTAAPDGVHVLLVRATDAQGNTGASVSDSVTVVLTAPSAPWITSAPPSHGSATTVTFAFELPPGTTALCRIDTGTLAACTSPVTVTFTTDGNHRFGVRARDAAGNRSAPAEAFYTLDRVAPAAPTITGTPASPTRATTPRWTFTAEPGAATECAMDGAAWTPCATGYSADLSAAADGLHTFAVRATDAAGNTSPTTSGSVVLDRTPPPAPVITGGPDDHTSDAHPIWSFTVEAGASARCRMDDGPWGPCDGSYSEDLSGEPDGIHSLEVRAVDSVGNVGPTTVAAFELDRVAAAAAVFTGTPATPGSDPTPEWAFSYEPGATAWCSLDGADALPCDGTFAAALGADGTHLLTVTVVDDAGNVSEPASTTYELDTIAPAAPRVAAPRTPDRDPSPEWLIELEPGSVAECSLDGGAFAACATVFAADLAGLDGVHELVVLARDAAGNLSEPTASLYTLDTLPPAAPVLLHTPDRDAWIWRFSVEPGAAAECSLDGVPWTACTSPMAGGRADRKVRFEVRAADRAGNRSPVTSVTVTPTRGTVVAPPTPPPPPPPGESGGPRPTTDPEPEVPAVAPVPPPGRNLEPDRPEVEVDADIIRRPIRDDRGFAGPVRDALEAAAESGTIPMLVVIVVLAFVAVQNRIDRQDPKLADAPIRHEPEYLEFE